MAGALWFAEQAEKFADTAARHLTEDPRDMRIAEVSAGIAQAYASLAAAESQRPRVVVAPARMEDAPQFRETREGVLVRIGTMMPDLWDLERLESEFSDMVGVSLTDALQSARIAWRMGDIAHRPPEQRPDWVRNLRDGGARFNLLANVSLEELFERQQVWHRQWAADFQEFKRRSNPDAVVNGDWPLQGGA
jgi:hypothetical protein